MTTNYERGRAFEYRCQRVLRCAGYVVIRSAQSRGPADLVAMCGGEILLVQCKYGNARISDEDRAKLVETARIAGATPILASAERGKGIVWENVAEGEE